MEYNSAQFVRMVEELKASDVRVRHVAAGHLWLMGPEMRCRFAGIVVPALLDALLDSDDYVRYQAMEALDEMDARAVEAKECLRQADQHPSELVRSTAARLLTRIEEEFRY